MTFYIYAMDCTQSPNPFDQIKASALSASKEGLCAGFALTPFFPGLCCKSTYQLNQTFSMTYWQSLRHYPSVFPVLVTTIAYQNFLIGLLKNFAGFNDFQASFVSGFCSAPLYAIFNGQSMGLSIKDSLKTMSYPVTAAITFREAAFLMSLNLSLPIANKTKDTFGDTMFTKNMTYFGVGFVGSIAGHPFDTWLTRSQANLLTSMRNWWKGGVSKGLTVACFNVVYQNTKQLIKYGQQNTQH